MYIFVLILFCDASVWILWTPFTKGAALINFTKLYKVHKVAQFNTQRSLLFLLQILNWGRNISSFLVSSFRDSSQGGPGTPEAHRLSPHVLLEQSKGGGSSQHRALVTPASVLCIAPTQDRATCKTHCSPQPVACISFMQQNKTGCKEYQRQNKPSQCCVPAWGVCLHPCSSCFGQVCTSLTALFLAQYIEQGCTKPGDNEEHLTKKQVGKKSLFWRNDGEVRSIPHNAGHRTESKLELTLEQYLHHWLKWKSLA